MRPQALAGLPRQANVGCIVATDWLHVRASVGPSVATCDLFNLNGIFVGAVIVINVQLCTVILGIEVCTVVGLPLTLTLFEGHSGLCNS